MDDKVGVALCLQLLQEVPVIKAVFFKEEETGMMGAKALDLKFLDDCKYAIEIDRRDNVDFSISMAGIEVNSKEFIDDCAPYLEKHYYKKSHTSVTDVYTLKLRGLDISVTNVSCGYYNPHSSYETVNITDVNDCYKLLSDIISNLPNKKYVHKYTIPKPQFSPINYSTRPIQVFGMYLDLGLKDDDGYYIYQGNTNIVPIPRMENYSYLINNKAFYNKKTHTYLFLESLSTGKADPTEMKKINFLLQRVELKEGGFTFVYSYIYDRWIIKEKAIATSCNREDLFYSYITKSTDAEWKKAL